MAKILSVVKANRNLVNNISQLAIRFMAAKCNYTTLVAPQDHLNLPREYPFMLANFNNKRAKPTASAKPTTKWTTQNPVQFMGFSTSTSTTDQIQNGDSNSSVPSTSVGDGNANPCLDLFLNPPKGYVYNPKNAEACRKRIEQLLPLAWSHNPLTTLKLICHILLHKSIGIYYDDQTFHTVTYWLHQNHPKTLACSVSSIARLFVGFHQFYDLLDLHLVKKAENQCELEGLPLTVVGRAHDIEGQDARQQKQKAVERYDNDPDYRFLHELISDIFAECLKSDIEKLKQSTNDDDKYRLEITKAAGSFLSMGSNFSDPTLLRESIARKVFLRESYPEYQGVEEADYTDSVLERLKNEVLLPLDKGSEKCLWDPRSSVEKYLGEVKAGKSKIAAEALLPHEIISYSNHWNFGPVAELQWEAMVEDIKKQGKKCKILNNCLAVCDACLESNFEMYEMNVAMALTLLISELNEEPWKGKVINFSKSPQLHLIQGDELRYKCDFLMKRMHCDYAIDLEKVFDLILEEAVNGNLKPEQMIKKVFIFTTSYKTCEFDYEAIQSKFKEKGYETAVPQIVLWKVRDNEPKEWVKHSKQPGMTILEDVSDNLISVLLGTDTEICQELSMEATISSKDYEKLVVVD